MKTSPGAVDLSGPGIYKLTGQLVSTRVDVILLTSKLCDLEEVRDEAIQEYEKFLKVVRTKAKTREEHDGPERDSGFSPYHDVLSSVREFV